MVLTETMFTFETKVFISSFVTLLALINPIQKIFLMTSLQDQLTDKELKYISIKSSLTAFFILIFFLFLGGLFFYFGKFGKHKCNCNHQYHTTNQHVWS